MNNTLWCLIDTKTIEINNAVFVVGIAAQLMRGWEPEGNHLLCWLRHEEAFSTGNLQVDTHILDTLEREGQQPKLAYLELARFAQGVPICAYNLSFDWENILVPEWQRLEVEEIGTYGLCFYQLAQRLLDTIAIEDYKLPTLCQYFYIAPPEKNTDFNIALTVDFLQKILRPLCVQRELLNFSEIATFSRSIWFPARISFGRYKGKHYSDARSDSEFYAWLESLKHSKITHIQEMGQWYLDKLLANEQLSIVSTNSDSTGTLTVYADPNIATLKTLVEQARNHLAALEAEYTAARQAVDVMQSRLFDALASDYLQRDILLLRLQARRSYLETLLVEGEKQAEQHEEERIRAEEKIHQEYKDTAEINAGKKELSIEEKKEIKKIWRKLVNIFHPDRFVNEPEKQARYEKLVATVNHARDINDVNLLREIAQSPESYMVQQDWEEFSADETDSYLDLQRLYESLQEQVIELIDKFNNFRISPEYVLYEKCDKQPDLFDKILYEYQAKLTEEIASLEKELAEIEEELEKLLC